MIPAKTLYESYNQKFLTSIESFGTWRDNLESWKYEILVLINHNNIYQFID